MQDPVHYRKASDLVALLRNLSPDFVPFAPAAEGSIRELARYLAEQLESQFGDKDIALPYGYEVLLVLTLEQVRQGSDPSTGEDLRERFPRLYRILNEERYAYLDYEREMGTILSPVLCSV